MDSIAQEYDLSPHVRLKQSDIEDLKSLDVPVAYNEPRRLQTLRDSGILYSNPQDPDFDRLSALAARVLKSPVGMINLIDTTCVWIKSKYGPPPILSLIDSPRVGSYCTYTILPESPDVFIVLDAMKDDRFKHRDGPKMGLVFYAGASIILDDMKIGTICVVDFAPRESFSMDDRTNLLDFAASVSILIKKYRDYNIGMARERSKMLFDLSHNLRTPLTSLELIVKNMKNDHSTSLNGDSEKSSRPNTESTKQKRANRQKQTKWNIDDAEMAVRQLNMIVENSLSAVRVVLCSDGMESNVDEICNLLYVIKNMHFMTSSLDSEGEKFVWNVQRLQTQFEYSEQQTYPEVLKFVIISLLRQLYTNWEQITIDFDYIYNTSQNIETDSVIDGSLSVCVSVSSTIHQFSKHNIQRSYEDIEHHMDNSVTSFDDIGQRSSLRTTPEDSDHCQKVTQGGDPNKVKSTKLNTSATANASVSMKSSYSTLDIDEYISSLDLKAIKQSIKSVQGVFEVMVTDPLLNCTSEIEFRMWIPCRVYKVSREESSDNGTVDVTDLDDQSHNITMTTDNQENRQSSVTYEDKVHITNMPKLMSLSSPLPSLRVLIIEDSIPIQKAMSRYLSRAGCDVTCADNGRLGLRQLQSSPFDMILVDFLMPVMSGMEVFERRYKWMKEQRSAMSTATSTTTITTSDQNSQDKDSNDSILNESALMIGMSTTALPAECASSFDMGMHFFVAKPISAEIMNTLVESIKRRRSERHARDMSHTSQIQTPHSTSHQSTSAKTDEEVIRPSSSSPLQTALTYIKSSVHCKEYVNMDQTGSHRFGVIISHANEVKINQRCQILNSKYDLKVTSNTLTPTDSNHSSYKMTTYNGSSSCIHPNDHNTDTDTQTVLVKSLQNSMTEDSDSNQDSPHSESLTKSNKKISWFSRLLRTKR